MLLKLSFVSEWIMCVPPFVIHLSELWAFVVSKIWNVTLSKLVVFVNHLRRMNSPDLEDIMKLLLYFYKN